MHTLDTVINRLCGLKKRLLILDTSDVEVGTLGVAGRDFGGAGSPISAVSVAPVFVVLR